MSNVNQKFRNHVTGVAFQLSLSGPMILALGGIRDNEILWRKGYDHGFDHQTLPEGGSVSNKAVAERGLIDAREYGLRFPRFELTDAGRLVVELLELAGLLPPTKLKSIPHKHPGCNDAAALSTEEVGT